MAGLVERGLLQDSCSYLRLSAGKELLLVRLTEVHPSDWSPEARRKQRKQSWIPLSRRHHGGYPCNGLSSHALCRMSTHQAGILYCTVITCMCFNRLLHFQCGGPPRMRRRRSTFLPCLLGPGASVPVFPDRCSPFHAFSLRLQPQPQSQLPASPTAKYRNHSMPDRWIFRREAPGPG